MSVILVTGGARSGKSRFAQELALKTGGPVLFVATATAGDAEMRQRIECHRRERPSGWYTLEVTTGVGDTILRETGGARVVLVDCITLLVSNVLAGYYTEGQALDMALAESSVVAEINGLTSCLHKAKASFILVTNEVGLGLVPDNPLGRAYRDLLGKANQLLAQASDEVYLLVAGIPLKIKP